MDEIIINHSLGWKIFTLVVFAVFIGIAVYLLQTEEDSNSPMLYFGIILFGLMGLYLLYQLYRERVENKPYLIISEKSIIVDKIFKRKEVFFSDVEYFSPEIYPTLKILIHYKDEKALRRKTYPEKPLQEISTSDLAIKPATLSNLLNERVGRLQTQNG
ncbi:MAG: hypothetical protein J5814_02545 [Bacteroidaceae bacterium]|nr:hypothetical protein [Bacteroidaceae bacterium]